MQEVEVYHNFFIIVLYTKVIIVFKAEHIKPEHRIFAKFPLNHLREGAI